MTIYNHTARVAGTAGDREIDITAISCFLPGTNIGTPTGEALVEDLRVGDRVSVHGSGPRAIIWIGRRDLATSSHPNPENVTPVLIEAGAFSRGVPARDLLVSPDHAMMLDGHLIPARSLTNGFTIRPVARPQVTYLHIELDAHSLIWAEGALTESFLECGNNRAAFDTGTLRQLFPSFNGTHQATRIAQSCAPFADNGPVVHEVRRRLLLQAQIPMTRDHAMSLDFLEDGSAVIRSRVVVPGETEPDPGDRRTLGVKIGGLQINGVAVPLDHPLLAHGWHAPEGNGRWTDGAAILPAALLNGSTSIDLTLAWTTWYPLRPGDTAAPSPTVAFP